jgi:hypothetical protein
MDIPILFTLILIMNKKDVYNDFIDNLETQNDVAYEVICIDNCNHQYTSARKAYNDAAMKASGKYLIFLHPDIRFINKHDLYEITKYIGAVKTFGVIGVAGCPYELVVGKRVILSNICHGNRKNKAGKDISKPEIVQTVDECFFVVEKNEFNKICFSEKEGWHLYAVELCLQFINEGKQNYVIPANLWHLSDGRSLDYRYMLQLRELLKEYKNSSDFINTTVKKWKTKGVLSNCYSIYYLCKQWIKGKMK